MASNAGEPNELDFDFQLATLLSVFEQHSVELLCDVLLEQAEGSLERAIEILSAPTTRYVESSPLRQTRLTQYNNSRQRTTAENKYDPYSCLELANTKPNETRSESSQNFSEHTTAEDNDNRALPLVKLLRWNKAASPTKVPRRTNTLVNLVHPDAIARQLPCVLVYNFLPKSLADELFLTFLQESRTWPSYQWYLFERQVTSPSTSTLYADHDFPWKVHKDDSDSPKNFTTQTSPEIEQNPHPSDNQQGSIYFAGRQIRIRGPYNQILAETRRLVENKVNEILTKHLSNYPHMAIPGPWRANAVVTNCYRGSDQGVGWHNDRLSNIGPFPTIASISLGVSRQFRIRRIPGPLTTTVLGDSTSGQTFNISLPHNALLVMLPPMQEEYQHTIQRHTPMDAHPLSSDTRISLTFRYYRPEFTPARTPQCHCGIPCQLRVVTKREESLGRYFYFCQADQQHGKDRCTFFRWLEDHQADLACRTHHP
ncbi:hypothetical protein IWQ61_000195 [Dispira simplex]|nr:hypothetical protein IWQ61_000195 [Dispira simplex]